MEEWLGEAKGVFGNKKECQAVQVENAREEESNPCMSPCPVS